jgi:hypothetical protein
MGFFDIYRPGRFYFNAFVLGGYVNVDEMAVFFVVGVTIPEFRNIFSVGYDVFLGNAMDIKQIT